MEPARDDGESSHFLSTYCVPDTELSSGNKYMANKTNKNPCPGGQSQRREKRWVRGELWASCSGQTYEVGTISPVLPRRKLRPTKEQWLVQGHRAEPDPSPSHRASSPRSWGKRAGTRIVQAFPLQLGPQGQGTWGQALCFLWEESETDLAAES